MTTDYTALTLPEIEAELSAIALDTSAVFGSLDAQQLNWRPSPTTWSVAQCFDHLLHANREMFAAIDVGLERSPAWWHRIPGLPEFFGRVMIRSQMPEATRKFTAPRQATPAASAIDADVLQRFVDQQGQAAARVRALDAGAAARIAVSPFVSFISYSILDACRLIVTHERRHFEQARRVIREPNFPASGERQVLVNEAHDHRPFADR